MSSPTQTFAAELDLTTPAAIRDPYPSYRRILGEAPVHQSPSLGGWVLARYDDVQAALRDPRLSADRFGPLYRSLPSEAQAFLEPIARYTGRWTLFLDPPSHTRMRALTSQAFSPKAVAAMRPRIQAILDQRMAALAGRREIEFVSELASELPTIVIAEIMGIPTADRLRFAQYVTPILHFFSVAAPPPEIAVAARQAMIDMAEYLRQIISQRRQDPQADVISALLAAEFEGQKLEEDDVIADCIMLINAGHETTRNLLATGTWMLLSHRDQLARLLAEPSLVPSAIEEILRHQSPVQRTSRMVREACDYGGQRLAAGQLVWVLLGAANRDPAQFAEPDRFDIARQPNRHLAFASGPHFCEGAPLARLEGEVAFTALLNWLPKMQLCDPEPDWQTSVSAVRALRTLRVRL